MTLLRNTFEGGLVGTTITAPNSSGASIDAFTTVTDTAAGACVYGTVTGVPGAKGMTFSLGVTSGTERRGWAVNAGADTGAQWFRFYVNPTDFVGAVSVCRGTTSDLVTQRWRMQLGSNIVTLRDSANTAFATSPSLAAQRWRVEGQIGQSASAVGRLKIFPFDSLVATYDSGDVSAINFGGVTQQVLFGQCASGTNVSGKIDDVAWSDAGWIGVSSVASSWQPKVNRHVAYLLQKTVGGNANYVKRRACVITGFASDGNPRLRCLHTGEVYGDATTGIVHKTNPFGAEVGTYVEY